jgi:hypothetical protein
MGVWGHARGGRATRFLLFWRGRFGLGRGEGAFAELTVVTGAGDFFAIFAELAYVVDGAAIGVKVEGDVRAFDGSVQRCLAERAGLGSGQLVVTLLQNEGRVSALAGEIDR